MAKPDTMNLPSHVQDAVKMFDSVVAGHVANNPKMAMEDKMASLVEKSGAFKESAHAISTDQPAQVASQAVPDHSVTGPAAGRG